MVVLNRSSGSSSSERGETVCCGRRVMSLIVVGLAVDWIVAYSSETGRLDSIQIPEYLLLVLLGERPVAGKPR